MIEFATTATRGGAYAKDSAWGMFVVPFTDFIAGDTKTPMLVLLASVGFVLLIACSNIAGLMLARASGRSREIAVRAALGASRWNLIRQTMSESLVLSFAGAVLGLALAFAGVRGLLALAPENSTVALDVRMDPTVLLFTALAAIAAGILFGIAPAWQISRLDRFDALREGGRSGSAGLRRQHMRAGLVIGEVALALVLLVGAGLFLRSLASLEDVNPGFQPNGLITGTVTPSTTAIFRRGQADRLLPRGSGASRHAARRHQGDCRGGGAVHRTNRFRFVFHRRTPLAARRSRAARRYRLCLSGLFRDSENSSSSAAARSPIRIAPNTAPVAMIDETLAREYWPNEDPVGKHMRNGSDQPWFTIVGVVGHTKNADLAGDVVKGRYYFSLLQQSFAFSFTSFVVRTESDPSRLAGGLRDAVRAVDPTLAVSRIKLVSDMVSDSLAPRRFVVTLLGIFAGLALLMAVIGLYGVISYSVTQRTQEIGLRMALGAQPSGVLSLVIGQGMQLAGIGAAIGLVASLIFSRLLKNQLFGVSAFDPLTFVATALVLIAAALLATYIPARRATRVDPMEALRHE